jgi:hypothetical protein
MKDAFAAFGSEVYGPLVVQILPGLIAVSSWLQVVYQRIASFRQLFQDYRNEAIILGLLFALAVGLIIEDWGSWVEMINWRRFKQEMKRKIENAKAPERDFDDEWNRYLRLAFKAEPMGQHYLRTILLRLKFEQNAGVAILVAGVGTFFLQSPIAWPWYCSVLVLLLGLYLMFVEARASMGVLADTRAELLKGISIVG